MSTMQAFRLLEWGKLGYDEVAIPEPGPGEVLVRVGGAGLCGSDLHFKHNSRYGWTPSHDRRPVIEAPTGVTVFDKDIPPNSAMDWMAEYVNLQFVEHSATGGHFAAAEKPDLIVEHLRTFFRDKRPTLWHHNSAQQRLGCSAVSGQLKWLFSEPQARPARSATRSPQSAAPRVPQRPGRRCGPRSGTRRRPLPRRRSRRCRRRRGCSPAGP
jgi:hypothetical protein